jgi:hypothetical protein
MYRISFRDAEGYSWAQTDPSDDLNRVMEDAQSLAEMYGRPAVVQVWEPGPYPSGGWFDYAEKAPESEG